MDYYGKNAHGYDVQAEACQQANKVNKPLIVSSTNASTKPNTMMIEVYDTIITNVAMARTLWPENHTRFTELESVQLW